MFDTYFSQYAGYYLSGDGARRDADGYFWVTGRVDDVINVSGHRIGTAEIEAAVATHGAVAEAAVVGYNHPIKGNAIYAFVGLMQGSAPYEGLENEIRATVTKEIGAFAKPELIQFVSGLPKTRSAKVMRRILRKIANNDISDVGDTSTLADSSVVTKLIDERKNR
jgi:acetyl-CoA synthetase